MAASAAARLGDAARGDDPTVLELEARVGALTGKDDALLLPSGAMANLAALMAHGCRGGEVIVEQSAHVYAAEGGALSVVAGAVARPLAGRRGLLEPDDVRAAMRGDGNLALAPTRLLCIENTHNAAGGTVTPLSRMRELHALAREAEVPLHLDGARLFNAAACLDVALAALCEHADSVMFSLCKGLGGPIGAMLAGPASFMRAARRAARLLGGGMRQAGLIAAPALVALRDPYPQHRRDNALARRLAIGLAAVDASLVQPDAVQTNIVNCDFAGDAAAAQRVARALREHGVAVSTRHATLRLVTHAQVDEAAVDAAIAAMAMILNTRRGK
jgi:threonine aldolase